MLISLVFYKHFFYFFDLDHCAIPNKVREETDATMNVEALHTCGADDGKPSW